MGGVPQGLDGDFFGQPKMVVFRVLPVHKPDSFGFVRHAGFDFDPVPQQFVDGPVAVVEALARIPGLAAEVKERPIDQRLAVLHFLEERPQQRLFNVRAARLVLPIAQIIVAQRVLEQPNHTVLRLALDLSDGGASGGRSHTRRVLPVKSSCIMPCLTARVLSRRC